jgi:hypothetical protein
LDSLTLTEITGIVSNQLNLPPWLEAVRQLAARAEGEVTVKLFDLNQSLEPVYRTFPLVFEVQIHSHSMVPGGFDVMS